jgi:hypothetical protein
MKHNIQILNEYNYIDDNLECVDITFEIDGIKFDTSFLWMDDTGFITYCNDSDKANKDFVDVMINQTCIQLSNYLDDGDKSEALKLIESINKFKKLNENNYSKYNKELKRVLHPDAYVEYKEYSKEIG